MRAEGDGTTTLWDGHTESGSLTDELNTEMTAVGERQIFLTVGFSHPGSNFLPPVRCEGLEPSSCVCHPFIGCHEGPVARPGLLIVIWVIKEA